MVQTPFGKKLKNDLKLYRAEETSALLVEFGVIEKTKESIEKRKVTFRKIREILSHFKSIDLTLERIYSLETLSVTELFEVKGFLYYLRKLTETLDGNLTDFKILPIIDLETVLDPDDTGINSYYIYDSYSEELTEIRNKLKEFDSDLKKCKKDKRLELSKKYGLKIRSNDEISIEKHKEELLLELEADPNFIYVSDTMLHRTYKIKSDDKILFLIQEISELKIKEEKEEYNIRCNLTKKINSYLNEIISNIDEIARLDLTIAKAYFAIAYNLVKPRISEENILYIENGIHLKVEEKLREEHLDYVPVSMKLKRGVTCITGANMGGKTICLKLIGQLQTMAQLGLFVPCDEFVFKPLNFVYLSSSDAQSIDKGLSTFGAEMMNISEVLSHSDDYGLILIDELARGTNPKEGYAISKAIINYLKSKSSISVITSHFDGLADDDDILHLQVSGLSDVNFNELNNLSSIESIHKLMDYRLRVINTSEEVPKDAINISKLMGINESILIDAKNILSKK